MKKYILLLATISLAACSTTNRVDEAPGVVSIRVPDLPPALNESAEPLPPIEGNTLGSYIENSVDTDRQYNSLAGRFNLLLEIYRCVQTTVNNKEDPGQCRKN